MNNLKKIKDLVALARQKGLDVSFSIYFEDDESGAGYECDAAHARLQVMELIYPPDVDDAGLLLLVGEVCDLADKNGFKLDDLSADAETPEERAMVDETLYFSRPWRLVDEFMRWVASTRRTEGKTRTADEAVALLGCPRSCFWDWLSDKREPSYKWSSKMIRLMTPSPRSRG